MSSMAREPADTTSLVLSQSTTNTDTASISDDRWRKYF
jgi:hypothetical protein